jgi:predicted DNA-binding WGR domain protein
VNGAGFTTRHGKIGTRGTEVQKKFASGAEAAKESEKIVREKVRNGYVEVKAGSATPGATGERMVSTVQGMISFAYGLDVDSLFGREHWDGQIDHSEDLKCRCEVYFAAAGDADIEDGLDWDDVARLVAQEDLRVVGLRFEMRPRTGSKAPKTKWVVGEEAAALYEDDAAWGKFFGVPPTVIVDLRDMVRRVTPDYDDDAVLLEKYEQAMSIDLDEDLTDTLRGYASKVLAYWCIVAQNETPIDVASAPGVEEGNEKSERMGLFIAPDADDDETDD